MENPVLEVYQAPNNTVCLKSNNSKLNLRECAREEPLLRDEEEQEEACCRICYDDDSTQLLTPCRCAGSMGYICRTCFSEWRKYHEERGVRCELCGFAFLFECQAVSRKEQVALLWKITYRSMGMLVLVIAAFVASYTMHRWVAEDMYWVIACLVLREVVSDIYNSFPPSIGSSAYSLKRIHAPLQAKAMDMWELHKLEWTRFGIKPDERAEARRCQQLKPCIEVLVLYIAVLFVITWLTAPKIVVNYFDSRSGRLAESEVTRPVIGMGSLYLLMQTSLHCLSFSRSPPIQIRRTPDGKPIVRSLSGTEKGRVVEVSARFERFVFNPPNEEY